MQQIRWWHGIFLDWCQRPGWGEGVPRWNQRPSVRDRDELQDIGKTNEMLSCAVAILATSGHETDDDVVAVDDNDDENRRDFEFKPITVLFYCLIFKGVRMV